MFRFVQRRLEAVEPLFARAPLVAFQEALDERLLGGIFGGDRQQLEEYKRASPNLQRTLLQERKTSDFAEGVFEDFARRQQQPVLPRKGQYSGMIGLLEPSEIPAEVAEKLDRVVAVFQDVLPPERPE